MLACIFFGATAAAPRSGSTDQTMLACLDITADAARLECYDRNARILRDAARKRAMRPPSILRPRAEPEMRPPAMERVTVAITGVSLATGLPILELENGERWQLQEAPTVTLRGNGGDRAEFRRGVAGYFIRLNGRGPLLSARLVGR